MRSAAIQTAYILAVVLHIPTVDPQSQLLHLGRSGHRRFCEGNGGFEYSGMIDMLRLVKNVQ
jgi:hypothetical protein